MKWEGEREAERKQGGVNEGSYREKGNEMGGEE